MSEKEMCVRLLDKVPAYKMGYVLAYLTGMTADETEDDAYCASLYREYENDPEKGDFVSFEAALKECGVSRDEL